MQNKRSRLIFFVFIFFIVGLVAYAGLIQSGLLNRQLNQLRNSIAPQATTEISIVYAPELDAYMPEVINRFNTAYQQGFDPITGQQLATDQKLIKVTGKNASSGTVMQGIVNAYQKVKSDNIEQPVIFAPSVSHWLQLANYQANANIFDLKQARATANAPVVMAIWESRLKAVQKKAGKNDIGWEELLQVFNSPNGWRDYGFEGRQAVYYGHTDPKISSTALSTLIQEFTASARYSTGKTDFKALTTDVVNNSKVQAGVREIEELIKHYSSRTTEFKEYIAQGPNYLDFVALEENDLIYINQGKTQYQPPEKLVALYPKEGTFIHEHPFATVNAEWVSADQKAAADVFTNFVLTEEIQKIVMENGFRPANSAVKLGYPFVSELGVDPSQPKLVINAPEAKVIAAIQQSWNFVKKRAELYLLIDTSGSMAGDKISSALKAVDGFVTKLPVENQVGLSSFNSKVVANLPLQPLETSKAKLQQGIRELNAEGTTALYDGLSETIDELAQKPSKAIRAVVLLSDGEDTSSTTTLQQLVNKINSNQNSNAPILIIPVAYGQAADVSALNAIARASATRVLSGDTEDIGKLLEIVSSYF